LFNFNRNTLVTAAVIIIMLLFISFIYFTEIDLPLFNWLSDIIYNLISPIINILHQLIEGIKDFFITLFSIDEVNQELKNLRQKNSVLERQILFLENINRENKRLRELLDFKDKVDYQMIGAEVIANSPSIWEKTITVNRGSRDGLEPRMPVITYQGYLVGRVENVGSNSAQIRLIIDHNFVVGGIVARTDSREIGLVKGSGRGDRPNIMDSIAWDADIKAGDVVLTSGLSNNFPPGLKIGEVAEVETDNYGLSQKADINLFMHQITLEEVMIIKNFNSEITVQNNQAENEAEINVAEESETNDGNSESEAN
jgi:hypothetical protein